MRLTKRDEYGNADIIGVDSQDLQCNLEFDGLNKVTDALNRLAYYEELEEQGLLVKLPCKVGDMVYFIKSAFSLAAFPIEAKVMTINPFFNPNHLRFETITTYNGIQRYFESKAIGKTVFLTREEAEKVLLELEGN